MSGDRKYLIDGIPMTASELIAEASLVKKYQRSGAHRKQEIQEKGH